MPFKKQYGFQPTPAQEPEEPKPSLWERIGGLPGVIGGGIRAITGTASAPGGIPGALTAGAGEAAAEIAEGSAFQPRPTDPNSFVGRLQEKITTPRLNESPMAAMLKGFAAGALTPAARIGTEASLGAVPFGKVLKEGRPLASAARGAAFSGVGEAGRELAMGEQVSPTAVGTAAAGGGLLTGALAKLLGKPTEIPTETYTVEPTIRSQRPPRPIHGTGAPAAPAAPPAVEPPTGVPYGYEAVGGPAEKSAAKASTTAKELLRDQRNLSAVEKWLERTRATARKEQEAQAAAEKIAAAKEGLEPTQPSISESISAPIPGGRERMTIGYKAPEEVDELGELLGAPAKKGKKGRAGIPRGFVTPPPEGPEGGRAREIYDAWIARGVTNEKAVDLAAQGIMPSAMHTPVVPKEVPPASEFSTAAAKKAAEGEFKAGQQAAGEPLPRETEIPTIGAIPEAPVMSAAEADKLAADQIAKEARQEFKVVPTLEPVAPKAPAGSVDLRDTQPEVQQLADELWAKYKALPSTDPAKRELGGQIAELRDFMAGKKMRESWRGAPAEGPALPAGVTQTKAARDAALAKRQAAKPVTQQLEESLAAAPPAEPTFGTQAITAAEKEAGRVPSRPMTPEEIAAETAETQRIAALPAAEKTDFMTRLKGLGEQEKGAIDPALLAKLGLGLTGAAVGAATDPFDNVLASALAGGAAGVGIAHMPQLLNAIGAAAPSPQELAASLGTPEGVKETAAKIAQTLPHWQRFSYLMDAVGLPANVLAGPYGSGLFGALESGLSGDPRGWKALKEMTPANFWKEYVPSFQEAKQLIGRAERSELDLVGGQAPLGERILASPGVAMTAGDVSARRILEGAGFTPDEARVMTLTSEPDWRISQGTLNFVRTGGPMAQMAAPFTRTPLNILEQGAVRTPGVGALMNVLQGNTDVRNILAQQALGAGISGASYGLGSELDPETAKVARRYLTNFAGRYSLPAGIAFAAGQAGQRGEPFLSKTTGRELEQALPLPTTEPFREWFNFITGQGGAPRGMVPRQLRELFAPEPITTPRRLSRLREQLKGQ